MFIKMSTDAATNKAIIHLQKLYPNETTILPKELANAPKEMNGSLPQRITFFGHGAVDNFGKKSVEEFSDMIVTQLTSYAEKEPHIKKSLSTIDLLGCNIGHHEPNRTSFAAAVTAKVNERLQQKGFKEIRFNAVTNLLSSNPESFSSTVLSHNNGQFSVKCVKSKEDESRISQSQISIQSKKRVVDRIENRVGLIEDKISTLHDQHQNLSAQLATKKKELPGKVSDIQTVHQKSTAKYDLKTDKDLRKKRKEIREKLRSIKDKKESLKKSLDECNSKIEQTQSSLNSAEDKYQENILQRGKTEDEKRMLKSSIKQEVTKIHSDTVASKSKWGGHLQTCLKELDSNQNTDIKASLKIITDTSQAIREGWLGSASIFGPGSTSATKLETLASDIASKNSQVETKEASLQQGKEKLKNQIVELDQKLQKHEITWQKLQAEDDKIETTKIRLENQYHQYSSNSNDEASNEISTLSKQISTLDKKISNLTAEKNVLINHQEKTQTNIQQLKQREDSLRTSIFRSEKDPRNILDTPQCNFTALVSREQQIGNTQSHRLG